jgi:hypothetical protein
MVERQRYRAFVNHPQTALTDTASRVREYREKLTLKQRPFGGQ